ncbi:MAG TPA: hypothetical protein VFQ61_37550 [Polyangiaceae bacterium]|nr:hypothetical protein [Polyangiaceae bacterium]
MRLLVGLTSVVGSVENYARHFDLLELRADPERLPAPKVLKKQASLAPALTTSILMPPRWVAKALEDPNQASPLLPLLEAANASWLILQTGPEIGPSRRAAGRLATLCQYFSGKVEQIGWEPHGPWEPETALAEAQKLGIVWVNDRSVEEGSRGPKIYTRLRSLGPGASLRPTALDHLGLELVMAETACVVFEGQPGGRARERVQQAVQAALEAVQQQLEEEDELEDDDDFEDEDELEDTDDEGPAEADDADADDADAESPSEESDDEDSDESDDEDSDESDDEDSDEFDDEDSDEFDDEDSDESDDEDSDESDDAPAPKPRGRS